MKRCARFFDVGQKVALGVGAAVLAGATSAHAEAWVPSFTVDTAPIFTVGGIVLTALGGIWCVRKVMSFGK
jgi:hypothetical protein